MPACAGMTALVERLPAIKTGVMPAQAGIPFVFLKS
jgi:hypothetical protein